MDNDRPIDDETFRRRYPALWARHQRKLAKKAAKQCRSNRKKSRPERDGCWWSDKDVETLRKLWGSASLVYIAKVLARSQRAVSRKSIDLRLGPSSSTGGAMSLRQFAKYSGFSRGKILNAAEALKIHISKARVSYPHKREGGTYVHQKSRTCAISEYEPYLLVAFLLKNDKTIFLNRKRRPMIQCPGCSKNKPHEAKGLCSSCYSRERKRASA